MTPSKKMCGVADRGAHHNGVPNGQPANKPELRDHASYRKGHRSYGGSRPVDPRSIAGMAS